MTEDPVPRPRTPATVREPIEALLREDLARLLRQVRKLSPDTDPTPAMLQRLADGVRAPIARIDQWSTEGYMKVGRVLIQIQDKIPHGGWMRLFKDGKNHVERPIPMSVQKAEALMRVAQYAAFREPEIRKALPSGSWRTMDELTRVAPKDLRAAQKDGRLHSAMTRGEALRLQEARRAAEEREPVAVDPLGDVKAALKHYAGDREVLVAFLLDYIGRDAITHYLSKEDH